MVLFTPSSTVMQRLYIFEISMHNNIIILCNNGKQHAIESMHTCIGQCYQLELPWGLFMLCIKQSIFEFFIIAFSVCAPCSYGLFNSACTIFNNITYLCEQSTCRIYRSHKKVDIDFTTYIQMIAEIFNVIPCYLSVQIVLIWTIHSIDFVLSLF